jgi:hypothetical protein
MSKLILFTILFNFKAWASIERKWELIESSAGISVWETKTPGTKLAGVKGEAIINAPINRVLFVLADVERSIEWVDGLKTSKVLEKNGIFETVMYQEFGLPWPVSNRDFVFRGKAHKEPDGKWIIEIKSENHPKAPKTSGVRGELIESMYVLTPLGPSSTKLQVEIICDPKGSIPIWLVNLIQKNWPKRTLNAISKQVQKPHVVNAILPNWI